MSMGRHSQGRTSQSSGKSEFQERTLVMDSLSAHFEKDHDLIGSQDPYFILTLCGDEVRTRTIKSGGVDPVWEPEEGYRLHDRGEHPELLAHAMNKNRLLKDSSLGEGKIAMSELGSGGVHSVPLYNKKGDRVGEFKFRAKEEQAAREDGPSEEPELKRHTDVVPVAPIPVMAAPRAQHVGVVPTAVRQGPSSGHTGMLRAGSIEPLAGNEEKTAHLHMGDQYLRGQGPTSRPGFSSTTVNRGPQQMPVQTGTAGMPQRGPTGVNPVAGIVPGSAGFPPHQGSSPGSYHQSYYQTANRGTPQSNTPSGSQGSFFNDPTAGHQSSESHSRGGYSGPSQGVVGGGDMGGLVQQSGPSRGFSDSGPAQRVTVHDGGVIGGSHSHDPSGTLRVAPAAPASPAAPAAAASPARPVVDSQRSGEAGRINVGGQPPEVHHHHHVTEAQPTNMDTSSHKATNVSNQQGPQGSSNSFLGAGPRQTDSAEVKTSHTPEKTETKKEVSGAAFPGGQVETIRKVTTTEDTDKEESSEYHFKGGGPIKDLETGDDHWEKALSASSEARRQAQLVEKSSREAHQKLLAAQEATRSFDKARREHMALEERMAALDLEAKRAQFKRNETAYEQMARTVSSKAKDVSTAQEAADVLRVAVNEKGEALDAEVQETKMHQERLAALEEELKRLQTEHENATKSHSTLLVDLRPKREKHNHLKEHFHVIRSELLDQQRKRAVLEMKEAELEGQLSTHIAESEAVEADLQDHDTMKEKLMMSIAEAENERRDKEAEIPPVTATLAEHRQRIGVLKQNTEAALATAEEMEHEVREKERAAEAAEKVLDQTQAAMGLATDTLTSAETAVKPFHEKKRRETTTMDKQHEVVEELHRKLGMAKADVDKAQARKEELWEKAKYYGEQADKAADAHYLKANKEFQQVLPGSTGVEPSKMTSHGSTTAKIFDSAGTEAK